METVQQKYGQTHFIVSERITEDEKSLSTLLPLKEKLKSTDWLIDKLVRTEDEIKIVAGRG